MAEQILKDCKLYLAEYDFTGQMNALAINYGAEVLDNTVFGGDTRSNTGGLKTMGFQHEGLWNGGDGEVDDVLFGKIALANQLMTICPTTGADGEPAYTGSIIVGEYSPGAAVGELFRFGVGGQADDTFLNGTIMQPAGAETSSGTGTAAQLGAVGASQKIYSTVHVLSASGGSPTLDITIESDDNVGMTTSATQNTHTQFTGVGSERLSADGAIADDYWQVNFTLGGTSPSFSFVVILAIQ